MDVIRHQHVSVHFYAMSLYSLIQESQISETVLALVERGIPVVPSLNDVMG